MDFLNSESFIVGLAAFSGVCAWLATIMPAPSDSSSALYKLLYEVITWCGANIGKAKNASKTASKTVTEVK